MSEYETILYAVKKRVAIITLNRPGVINAISSLMRSELQLALQHVEANKSVRVVVLTGNGRAFSAGQDLDDEGSKGVTRDVLLKGFKPIIDALKRSDKLYICAINGACAGGSIGVALGCDLVFMAEDAYFYLAFAAIGLIPDCGIAWRMVNIVGYQRALELIIGSGKIKAPHAQQLGLCTRVIKTEQLLAETLVFAEAIARGAPLAQRAAKRVLQHALENDFDTSYAFETKQQIQVMQSKDADEGVLAFLEKRAPQFTGE